MNFLAHLFLSYPNKEEMTGNFIGDFVKGKQFEAYPPNISMGIKLHRYIDEYTDNHSLFRKTRDTFKPHFKRYAGVVADITLDHFLAKHWATFHKDSLDKFSERCYDLLAERLSFLPERVQYILPKMKASKRLQSYEQLSKTADAIEIMSHFRSFYFDKTIYERVVMEDLEQMELRFLQFFREMQEFVTFKRIELNSI